MLFRSWVNSFTWAPDSTRLFFTSEDRGRTGVQMVQAAGGGLRNIITGASTLDDVQFSPDGRTMIYTEMSGSRPVELYRVSSGGGTASALTHLNDGVLLSVQLTPLEELITDMADRSRIQSFIVKPANFDARSEEHTSELQSH